MILHQSIRGWVLLPVPWFIPSGLQNYERINISILSPLQIVLNCSSYPKKVLYLPDCTPSFLDPVSPLPCIHIDIIYLHPFFTELGAHS